MKHSNFYASTLLPLLAAATPQWGPGGPGYGWGGPFAAFPSCVSSCRPENIDYTNPASLCTDAEAVSNLNNCVDSSDCSDDEKNDVKETIAQLCANAGATITAAPFATYSVTSGGSAWPSEWATDSAWASAASAWSGGNGWGVASGWHGGGYGPFGPGGPNGNGWGPGPWGSSGSWTGDPWTAWWGTSVCPPSTWTGWTDGTWGSGAPWTTWTACTAITTATTVYTTMVTVNGQVAQSVGTSYGYGRVVEATGTPSASGSPSGAPSNTDSGAMPTKLAVAGTAAGVLGILAGVVLL